MNDHLIFPWATMYWETPKGPNQQDIIQHSNSNAGVYFTVSCSTDSRSWRCASHWAVLGLASAVTLLSWLKLQPWLTGSPIQKRAAASVTVSRKPERGPLCPAVATALKRVPSTRSSNIHHPPPLGRRQAERSSGKATPDGQNAGSPAGVGGRRARGWKGWRKSSGKRKGKVKEDRGSEEKGSSNFKVATYLKRKSSD